MAKKPNLFKWIPKQKRMKQKNAQIAKVEKRLKQLKKEKQTIKKQLTAKYKKMK